MLIRPAEPAELRGVKHSGDHFLSCASIHHEWCQYSPLLKEEYAWHIHLLHTNQLADLDYLRLQQ